jgi:hypothetical protein
VSIAIYNSVFVPGAIARMASRNIESRIVTDYSSLVYNYERKVAFRIGNIESGYFTDFHWMKQHSDETWSHKPGSTPSIHLASGVNPDVVSWGSYYYNSPITYFAIYYI